MVRPCPFLFGGHIAIPERAPELAPTHADEMRHEPLRKGIAVDPDARRVQAEAGLTWGELDAATQGTAWRSPAEAGLAPLAPVLATERLRRAPTMHTTASATKRLSPLRGGRSSFRRRAAVLDL